MEARNDNSPSFLQHQLHATARRPSRRTASARTLASMRQEAGPEGHLDRRREHVGGAAYHRRGAGAGTRKPHLVSPPTRFFWCSGPALDEGVETHVLDGVSVRIYGPEKRSPNAFATETRSEWTAPRRALERPYYLDPYYLEVSGGRGNGRCTADVRCGSGHVTPRVEMSMVGNAPDPRAPARKGTAARRAERFTASGAKPATYPERGW